MFKTLSRRAVVFLPLLMSGAMALPAIAQTQPDTTAAPVVEEVTLFTEIDLAPVRLASKIMDADAYTVSGEKLGDVSDVMLDENNRAIAVVVGVGGFLGIDETDVAIPIGKVSFTPEGSKLRVVADVTKEEVKTAAGTK